MIYITEDQIITLHNNLIKFTGGKKGVKDYSSLDFCVKSPFVTFDGKDLYPTIIDKYATLCFTLITKHPFHDGNKRIGMHILKLGLKLNSLTVSFTVQNVIDLGLGIASKKIAKEELINFLYKNQVL